MDGLSDSAKRRRLMKEAEPEKYRELLERHNKRYQEAKRKREEYWASGTRQALDDKEAYLEKRRKINRRSYSRGKAEQSEKRATRRMSAKEAASPPSANRVKRKDMLAEERREHDAAKRRERKSLLSRQKRTADKAKHAQYMREWRRSQKAAPIPTDQPGPSTTSDIPPSTPIMKRSVACFDLHASVPKQPKMRQHCYNTTTKIKTTLNFSFTPEESAAITTNLLLRKTPEKRKKNLDKLLENNEFRRYCRRKLVLDLDPRIKKLGQKSYTSTKELLKKSRTNLLRRVGVTKADVMRFYTQPAVSRVLPHQRYATKWGPGHIMVTTLKNAHKAYEDFSGQKISFSKFASLRPRNVKKLGSLPCDTCLCVTYTNVKLKIDALNPLHGPGQSLVSEGKLLKFLLCPFKDRWPAMDCVSGNCAKCKDLVRPFTSKCFEHFFEELKWFHWERREVDGRKKLDIHAYQGTVCDLLEQLAGDLNSPTKGTTFVQHLFNAYWQQSQYDLSKNVLQQGQVVIVQDFAENRKATYSQEVKSAHFGKAQISLHPSVCFFKNSDGQLVRHVAMFFSDDIGHDYHAVHCYTKKVIELLKQDTQIDEVILWSDGAASQYKGRGTFADLSLYPFSVQRNFFGSEHGKGEADGETGRFSQAMARAVASGRCFRNAKDMVEFGTATYTSDAFKKYSFILVPKEDIVRDRPETDVGTLPGTRSLHQLVRRTNYVLSARKLSCFCSGCSTGRFDCCINQAHVQPFETFKMRPSNPSLPQPADPEEQDEEEEEVETPTFSSSEIPRVGDWLEVIGSVVTKKSTEDRTYYANVVSPPEDGSSDYFHCQFFKRTAAGSYVHDHCARTFHIVPGTVENYRWRIIAAPQTTSRGHYFFK